MTTRVLTAAFVVALFLCARAMAQTSAFTYQGKLNDTSVVANGPYDMSFKLFDALTNGSQIGGSLDIPGIQVANGIFTVNLDFGATAFTNGSPRFLQIEVRPGGTFGQLTLLTPRQPVTSTPFAIKSISSDTATSATNSTQLGGIAASQYVVTTDPRMTDARSPTSGSTNYVQNGTLQQASTNFNISGNGVAGGSLSASVINAATEYDIAGVRILSYPGNLNLFVGAGAGISNASGVQNSFFGGSAGNGNSTGSNNAFFGTNSGLNNTTGFNNAFFGSASGLSNTTASANAFFGVSAGQFNNTGVNNSFFGAFAGQSNSTGNGNAFFGRWAGLSNSTGSVNAFFGLNAGMGTTTGDNNSFFGGSSGMSNTTGFNNSFFGASAGSNTSTGVENAFFGRGSGTANSSGNSNTAFGFLANFGSNNLVNANAIGYRAYVTQSNSLVLGSINGINGAITDTKVGIGITDPISKLHIVDSSNIGLRVQTNTTGGTVASFGGFGAFQIDASGTAGGRFTVLENGNVGIGTGSPGYKMHVRGENIRVEGDTTSTMPRFSLNYTGALTDNKKWQIYASADAQFGYLNFTALSDAEDFESTWMRVKRLFTDGAQVEFPQAVIMTQAFVTSLGTAGSTALCRNASNQISTCSSSLRYKTNIGQFSDGLSFVNKLRPISFDWKDGGMKDVGFGAEDIAKIDPRFVTYNADGEVEGVKYDRLSVAFVNAFKEQQLQIEKQQALIEQLEKRLEQLEKKEQK